MKTRAFFFITLLVLFSTSLQAQKQKKLYIGIEKNRIPYSDLDDTKQAQGILVSAVRALCDDIDADCEFVSGRFDTLLNKLQTYQINGVILIENLVIPEFDNIKTTAPLCIRQPVLIHKPDPNQVQNKEGFSGKTIGVMEGTLTHLYLLDEYSSNARLKPYFLLENGVFDLVMNRIDTLAVNLSFFKQRVQNTHVGQNIAVKQMLSRFKEDSEYPDTSMTLALRASDTELYQKISKAQANRGRPTYCSNLLIGSPNSLKKPIAAPPINFDDLSQPKSGSTEPQTKIEEKPND